MTPPPPMVVGREAPTFECDGCAPPGVPGEREPSVN